MDTLKIDRALIASVAEDERDRAIIRTMVALDDRLGLATTAEGIETGKQLLARPMPAAELASWLAARREHRRADPSAGRGTKTSHS